jgi:hypothetical protein
VRCLRPCNCGDSSEVPTTGPAAAVDDLRFILMASQVEMYRLGNKCSSCAPRTVCRHVSRSGQWHNGGWG